MDRGGRERIAVTFLLSSNRRYGRGKEGMGKRGEGRTWKGTVSEGKGKGQGEKESKEGEERGYFEATVFFILMGIRM